MQKEKRVNTNNIHILPRSNNKNLYKINQKVVVVVNLYYMENIEIYLTYLKNVDEYIHIYICSSNEKVISLVKKEFESTQRKNVFYIKKNNRGRDISALLVSFKPYIEKYDYLCFLHDKKEKHEFLKEDLNLWILNLWGNMISSREYIQDAIGMLQEENYGLLLPSKPIGKYMDSWYIEPWKDNYNNTIQLAEKLGLSGKIEEKNTDLISLGSVFWCKTKALEKLFLYDWKYEDFPDEPMPNDGTISHSIERILGFVAIDAGYKVGTIMCAEYTSQLIGILQDKLEITYEWLWRNIGIKNTYQLNNFDDEIKKFHNLFGKREKVFLYGAGVYGEKCLKRLEFLGYKPAGFIVSDGKKEISSFCGYPVYEVHEIDKLEDCGIIISTNSALQEVIGQYLENKGFYNYLKTVVI